MSSDPSVSLLLPTHRKPPQHAEDRLRLKNLLKEASLRLNETAGKAEAHKLMDRLTEVVDALDLSRLQDGLAIFVSSEHQSAHRLPFPVRERVAIGPGFSTRDLVRAMNRKPNYGLLVLTRTTARFFLGHENRLYELEEAEFPLEFVPDEPADQRIVSSTLSKAGWYPSRSDGPSGDAPLAGAYAPDESAHRQEQMRHFFIRVHHAAENLLKDYPVDLAIAGVSAHVAAFSEAGRLGQEALAVVSGSHDGTPVSELGDLSWAAVRAAVKRRAEAELAQLKETMGGDRHASGIEAVWQLSQQKPVAVLLVEQDYHYPATVNRELLVLEKPAPDDTNVVDDAVDEVIEKVMQKGGRVVFCSDGDLREYGSIAALFRY